MKLETAYGKLRKHQNRREIRIRLGWRWKTISAYWKNDCEIPAELEGGSLNENGLRHWWVQRPGLANAMTAMADKLDRVEMAITKHKEAVGAAKEANR